LTQAQLCWLLSQRQSPDRQVVPVRIGEQQGRRMVIHPFFSLSFVAATEAIPGRMGRFSGKAGEKRQSLA
jgi:hypothetical protein